MSELAIFLARLLFISKFSTSLLKCLATNFCQSLIITNSFVVIIQNKRFFVESLLREERIDSFPKFSIVRDNSLVFPKNYLLVLRSKVFCRLLDSSFLVFKNLFLSFDLFIIAFLSSLVIKLQLFERIYLIFFGACLSRTDKTVSLNFDSGAL